MTTSNRRRQSRYFRATSVVLSALMVAPGGLQAAPVGGTVVSGVGTISTPSTTHTLIDQASQRLALDWQSFDVAENERVQFVQPNSGAVALNRILDGKASQIFGQIDANGQVILQNQHGILFGRTARVDTGSLVATSLAVDLAAFERGDAVLVLAADSEMAGAIVNRGVINAATGGSVALIGGAVANEGVITARLGRVDLAAGSEAALTFDEDNLIGVRVTKDVLRNLGADAAVSNSGDIIADGGVVVLSAAAARGLFDTAINSTGLIQANAAEERDGRIFLTGGEGAGDVMVSGTVRAEDAAGIGGDIIVTGDRIGLVDQAVVSANGRDGGGTILIGGDYQGANPDVRNAGAVFLGADTRVSADATGTGDGGKLIVWSDEVTRAHGELSARGGVSGGNGGFIETSSHGELLVTRAADVSAVAGIGGHWLLDPRDITVIAGATESNTNANLTQTTFSPTGSPSTIGVDLLEAALDQGATVTLQTTSSGTGGTGTITWNSDAVLDYDGHGVNAFNVTAWNNIVFNGQILDGSATGTDTLDVTFTAGGDGAGDITVGSTGRIETGGGLLSMSATGGDILVNDSGVIGASTLVTGGGNVTLTASSDLMLQSGIDSGGGNISLSAGGAGAGSSNQFGLLQSSGTISINGGAGADNFLFADLDFVGALDGAGGTDRLTGSAMGDAVTITGANGGTAYHLGSTGMLTFSGVETVDGGEGGDLYEVQAGGSLSGGIVDSGVLGIDTLRGDLTVAETFTLAGVGSGEFANGATTGFGGIEALVATSAGDALAGTTGDDLFVLNSSGSDPDLVDVVDNTDTSMISAYNFLLFDGGAGNDYFGLFGDYAPGEAITVAGGDGDDIFDLSYLDSTGTLGFGSFFDGGTGGETDGDRIYGSLSGDYIQITGANTGTVNSGLLDFSDVDSLDGYTGADTYEFAIGGSLSGGISDIGADAVADLLRGAAGVDEDFLLSTVVGEGTFDNGTATTWSGIEALVATNAGDALVGTGNADYFRFNYLGGDSNQLHVYDASFTTPLTVAYNFLQVEGGAGNDFFAYFGDYMTGDALVMRGDAGDDLLDLSSAGVGVLGAGSSFEGGGTGEVLGDLVFGTYGNDLATVSGIGAGTFNAIAFSGVENLDAASDAGDTLTSSGGSNTWDIGGGVDVISGIAFSNFDAISGGTGNDTFNINGNVGYDLLGNGGNDTFNFNIGGVLGGSAVGGTGDDTFNLLGGTLTGSFDGGSGGESAGDLVIGSSADEVFQVTGIGSGALGGSSFAGIEYLEGGDGADQFMIGESGYVFGVDGGAGNDSLSVGSVDGLGITATTIDRSANVGITDWAGIDNLVAGTSGGDITIVDPVSFTGTVVLGSSNAIVGGGNSIAAASITATAVGDVTLVTDTDVLDIAAGTGSITVDEADGLTALRLVGADIALTTGGTVTDGDTLLDIDATGIATLDVAGAIGSTGAFLYLRAGDVVSASTGDQFLGFAGDLGGLNIDAGAAGVSLAASAPTTLIDQQSGDAIVAGSLALYNGTWLLDGDNVVGTLSGAPGGDVTLHTLSALTVDGLVRSDGAVTINVDSGDVTLTSIDTDAVDDDTNDITVTALNGNIVVGQVVAGIENDVTLSASGSITDVPGATIRADQLLLDAGGNIGQSTNALSTDVARLAASAGGSIWINEASGVRLGAIDATGDIAVNAVGDIVLGGLVETTGGAGSDINIDSATGGILMLTDSGTPTGITQTADSTITLAAENDIVITTVDAGAGGTVYLDSNSGVVKVNEGKTFSPFDANITAYVTNITARGGIGSVSGTQLVIDSAILNMSSLGPVVQPILLQDSVINFSGNLLPPLSQLLGNLNFDPELEGLAYLDPAIFTAVGSYAMDENALELPEDQKVADGAEQGDEQPVVQERASPPTPDKQARGDEARPVPLAMY